MKKTMIPAGIILAGIAALGLAAMLTKAFTMHPPTLRDRAQAMALGIVSNGLPSPATARFVSVSCSSGSNSVFVVMGKVDTQNQYGALIRENFLCGITNDGGNLRFVLANAGDHYWTPNQDTTISSR